MRNLFFILMCCLSCGANAQSIVISTPADTVCSGSSVVFTATITAASPHYRWKVNNVSYGGDTASINIASLANNDLVKCEVTDAAGANVLAVSNVIHMTVLPTPNAGSIVATDTSVCIGTTIMLSNTVGGGVWSTNNSCISLSGGSVLGLFVLGRFEGHMIPAVANVYYVVSDGKCSDTARQIVTTASVRPASLYSPPSFVCVGKSAPFWENEPIERIFATTGHVAASTAAIGGISPGTDYVYNITTNQCGSDTFRWSVNVHFRDTASAIVASSTHLCVGATITLSSATKGINYWTKTNNNVLVSDLKATGAAIGRDTLTLNTRTVCEEFVTASIMLTVEPPTAITGASSVCTGRSITLSNATPGGTWSNYNSGYGTIKDADLLYSAATPGIDTIYYRLGECTVKQKIDIYPSPEPLAINEYLCLDEEVDMEVPAGGVWTFNYPDILKIDPFYPNRLRAADKGSLVLQYTLPTGCFSAAPVTVLSCDGDLSIFPSPAHSRLIVQCARAGLDGFTIVNSAGALSLSGNATGMRTIIDVSTLAPGLYFIRLNRTGGQRMARFVKE